MPRSAEASALRRNAAGSGTTVESAASLLGDLFPICRSITGDGVRRTFKILRDLVDFHVREVASGTVCFDWVVPDEWNVRDAFIATEDGRRVVDFRVSNIHLVSYSEPVDAVLSFAELEPHLHVHHSLPKAIPYRTSYYRRGWGFCLTAAQLRSLDRSARYHVRIDTTLAPGSLSYGERVLQGGSGREFLVSTYCCHPSMANDNLSGVVIWTLLLKELAKRTLRHSYRFVIAPETIGAIAYLCRNEAAMKKVEGGFVISTAGGPGPLAYKHTFESDGYIDRVALQALRDSGLAFVEHPFSVMGSDERSYSSPAFRIPVGTICKDKYYEYAEYHSSLDNLDFVKPEALVTSLNAYLSAIDILERDARFDSLAPPAETQLGKRGLYGGAGGATLPKPVGEAGANDVGTVLTVLFWADGHTSLLEMAERTRLPFAALADAADRLKAAQLIREARA
ncbi:MAG: DUF4910 domain-containing protein [Alphaproteobacteria bacterium]|nr:DUF4910 domain-containing protein [Alphaproteobacteria bacterium]